MTEGSIGVSTPIEGMRRPLGAPPSALPSHMLARLASPTGSETTVIPDAADREKLLALDTEDLQHSTPEVGTPDIANIQRFLDHHPNGTGVDRIDSSPPPSLRLPSPAHGAATAPLHPDISAPPPATRPSPPPPGNTYSPPPADQGALGVLPTGQSISTAPAPPLPTDMNVKSYDESLQPHLQAPVQALEDTIIDPPPISAQQAGSEPGSSTSSLGGSAKRTLPISPLALLSAVPAEGKPDQRQGVTQDSALQQSSLTTPQEGTAQPLTPARALETEPVNLSRMSDYNDARQSSESAHSATAGAGQRSRAVISEMTPIEIDQVLQSAANRLVAARREAGTDPASDSELSSRQDSSSQGHVNGYHARPTAYPFPNQNLTASTTHLHGPHLSRTTSDTTDVLVSHPVSVETSRQNSDDEEYGPHSHHRPLTNLHFTPLPQQQPEDTDVRRLSTQLQKQQLERSPADLPLPSLAAAPSTPGPSTPSAEVAGESVMASAPAPAPAPPSRQHSQLSLLRRKDKDREKEKDSDPKLLHRKSARETSHGIFHDLKRFFNVGKEHHTSPTANANANANATPVTLSSADATKASSIKSKKSGLGEHLLGGEGSGSVSGTDSPRHGPHSNAFETDLRKKYGKLGKVLGRGAGGTVRVLCRSSDHKVFAIKQFRKRRPNESERSYVKKVTSEYCLGSTFHHPNIIETMDIVKESGNYYEVMEFAKYELFSAVMSGLMGRDEIACCFRGIINGVAYLHGLGVAHRDLKLDNCVMNERGMVKIIDFGCSMVYQLPFEKKIQMARGVSGSDPYIAPELFTQDQHDPRLADVWSMGIIFLCMTLRRFPWRIPKADQDPSFQAFAKPDGTGKLRLLKLMPRESRPIMSRILEMDPRRRVLITDVLEDPWVKNVDHCTIDYMSPNHPHHLGDDGTICANPNEGITVLPPSVHGSESGRSFDVTPMASGPNTPVSEKPPSVLPQYGFVG
ncbi:serine/threonine protein kinase [Mortierella alpina]|nr:serine/threonine protein kinase [Mortierella alpina]